LIAVVHRPPATITVDPPTPTAVLDTQPLGFAGAAEDDRRSWLNGFRRLLDGLDVPTQVVIAVAPGTDEDLESDTETTMPEDLDDLRGADLSFANAIRRSMTSHVITTSFATAESHVARLGAALTDMGVRWTRREHRDRDIFGSEAATRLRHTHGFSRTWYIDRLPGTDLEPGWLHRLLPSGLALTLAYHIVPLPAAWIVGYLQRQLVSMRANTLLDARAGANDPALAGALPTAEDLQRRIASSQDKAFHVSTYLTVTAPTDKEIETASHRIEAAARAVLCEMQPTRFRMRDAFVATMPGGKDALGRTRVVDSTTLTTFFPWNEPDLQEPGGLFLGRNRATGAPVLVDPFDQRRYANANIAVFGHSGAGKTYLLSALAMGALGKGVQVCIIDPEHEYGALAKQLGGVDVRLALGSGHALNVLDLKPSDRHDEAWLGPAAADVVDLCACVCGGLDEAERATVEGAVRRAYAESPEPVLRDVAERLPHGSRTALILHRWVTGSLGQMFSAPTNVDLEAPIVVFGMRELRDEMIAPVHFLLAEALWARIKRKDRRRMLVVDELGLLFEDATIRRFVVSLARRIRKYDGSLVFATQNPGDLLASDQGAVVASNPALVFFGAQRPGEAAKLQQAFQISPQQRGFLESARRGDFVLAAGGERLALQVKAPPWQEEAMRSARSGTSAAGRSAARSPPPSRRLTRTWRGSFTTGCTACPTTCSSACTSNSTRSPISARGAAAGRGSPARSPAGSSRWSTSDISATKRADA
jgi:hypothetical protein